MDNALHRLFIEELSDLISAETQLTKALPKMVKSANSEQLAAAFSSHLSETEEHLARLHQVFQSLGETPKSTTCQAMKGLLKEAQELKDEEEGSAALDAALIAAAQKVEHYEIASYGTVCTWAEQMGHTTELGLLKQTLGEEKAADQKLTEIAETEANGKAERSDR